MAHKNKTPTNPPYAGYCGLAHTLPKSDKRRPTYTQQRKTRGFDDTELWNLDITLARFLHPRLKAFREADSGTPNGYTKREWTSTLRKIESGLKLIAAKSYDLTDVQTEKANQAMVLLAKVWPHLWN